jgi:hypothetical protein
LVTDQVLNPVDVEQQIVRLANDISRGVREVSARHKAKLDADRIYDHAFAVAFLAYDGPANAKKYAAEKVTQQERLDRDVAEVAYQHAQRQMRALEGQLSAFQSVMRSVNGMYGAAGRGQ